VEWKDRENAKNHFNRTKADPSGIGFQVLRRKKEEEKYIKPMAKGGRSHDR